MSDLRTFLSGVFAGWSLVALVAAICVPRLFSINGVRPEEEEGWERGIHRVR